MIYYVIVPFNMTVMYLLCAFVQWNLDPGDWSMDARFCAAMLMFCAGGFSTAVASGVKP